MGQPPRCVSKKCRGDHWSPANPALQRVFRESSFTEKRARAGNARPYKSYLTAPALCQGRPRREGKPAFPGETALRRNLQNVHTKNIVF